MALPFSYNVRNLIVRWRDDARDGAIALVVAVLIVLILDGARLQAGVAGDRFDRYAVLTQRGSTGEFHLRHLARSCELGDRRQPERRDSNGRPLASPEVFVVAALPRRTAASTSLDVVTPLAFQVRQVCASSAGDRFHRG